MSKIILKDALTVMPERIIRTDVMIEGSRIAKIGPDLQDAGAREIDCHELLMLPGLIDEHVHFRDPGMPQKATIYSESRAALLGGVTSFMDMPNTLPPTVSMREIDHKCAIAAKNSVINYAFHLGADKDNLEEIKALDPRRVPSVKVYMGATTGTLLVDEEPLLDKIFKASPIPITAHCEDNQILDRNSALARAHYGKDIPFYMHPVIRSRECCVKSSKLAIDTALRTGASLHIMHISTKEEVRMLAPFAQGDIDKRQITGEACLAHAYFSEGDYAQLQGFLKCNPAVKSEQDRLAVMQGIREGILCTIGTDHAPHELSAKTGKYASCASGMPSIQFLLPALCEIWRRGEMSLEDLVKATALNPAKRFKLKDRGSIEEGKFADLTLVNMAAPFTVTPQSIQSICGWSPFTGHTFTSRVTHVFVNGHQAVNNGKLCTDEPGMPLEFDRN